MSDIKTVCSILLAMSLVSLLSARAQDLQKLGPYGKRSSYCGSKAVPRDISTIPFIGCFYLSAGHSAQGTLSKHQIDLSVDTAGNEVFKVDGIVITDTQDTASETNLAYVGRGAAGYTFCEGPTDRNTMCPADITIFSRNADKSVLFLVSECLAPQYRICVTTPENWDYENSRRH